MNLCAMSNSICLCAGRYHSISLKSYGVEVTSIKKVQAHSAKCHGMHFDELDICKNFCIMSNYISLLTGLFLHSVFQKSHGEVSQVSIKMKKMAVRF